MRLYSSSLTFASVLAVCAGGPAAAQAAAEAAYERAVVQSVFTEHQRTYVRLKLVQPARGFPFRTVTYRVAAASVLPGLRAGASVAFRAQRAGGENTIVALRSAPPCDRLGHCPPL